jgi:hypothetical protein
MQKTKKPQNDQEWAEYLAGVLKQLDCLEQSQPDDGHLRHFTVEASGSVAVLAGYLLGGTRPRRGPKRRAAA